MDVTVTDQSGNLLNTVVVDSVAEAQAAFPDMNCQERVIAPPPASRYIRKVDWLGRFTLAELGAINLAMIDQTAAPPVRAGVATIMQLFDMAPDPMNMDDARTAESLAAFVQMGLLAPNRPAEILA